MKTLAQIHGLVRTHSTPWAHCVIDGHMLTLIGKAMDENAPDQQSKAQRGSAFGAHRFRSLRSRDKPYDCLGTVMT
jgi:hypothetical protein